MIFDTDSQRQEARLLIKNYQLTLAEILYHLPDHPSLLQTFIWQDLDIAPKFPVLNRFLGFWEENIEGKLHSVRVDSTSIVEGPRFQSRTCEILIH